MEGSRIRCRYSVKLTIRLYLRFVGFNVKETLIKSEFPAIQGCIAKINDISSLILRGKQKSHFCFPCSDKSRACPVLDTGMDLFRASLIRTVVLIVLSLFVKQLPAELPVEPLGRIEILPVAYPDHWIIVHDAAFLQPPAGKMVVVDPTKEKINEQFKGMFDAAFFAAFTVSTSRSEMYVGEHFYSRVTRGERTDAITVYDKTNLESIDEIILTGSKRAEMAPTEYLLNLSNDEALLFVYNYTPATSVTVIDIVQRKILNEVNLPGCALIYPTGKRGFSSLCSNASIISYQFDGNGNVIGPWQKDPFFSIKQDALFERPAIIDGIGYFPTVKGNMQEIDLNGSQAEILGKWSLVTEDEIAHGWRPGGMNLTAADASGHFYVLMHRDGYYGSHKNSGTEVWVYDSNRKRRVRRIPLTEAGFTIGVTKSRDPILIVSNNNMNLDVYDASTGEYIRTLSEFVLATPVTIYTSH